MKVTNRILQTAIAYGISTIVGFLGTIYFARTLGPEPIGMFSLGLSIVLWGSVFDFGIGISTIKRISEGDRQSRFLAAALLMYAAIVALYCIGLLFARDFVNGYVGADVFELIILLFIGVMMYGVLSTAIKGLNSAHIKNWIDVIEQVVRVVVQVILVALGFSVVGLYTGYVVSITLGVLCAILYLYIRTDLSLRLPTQLEFRELFAFAKYSWLSRVKSQAVSWMDVFILGFFVTQSLVGVYQIAWTVSKTFGLLSKAISENVFPEASGLTQADDDRLQMLVQEGLVYSGYVAIPGTLGAAVLGRRVLEIYGSEFQSGAAVLVILLAAVTVRSYEQHLLTIIDSIDRPNITFRINFIFIVSNVVLNITLIWFYGLMGAAVATLVSTLVSLLFAWYYTTQFLDVQILLPEVRKQVFAAVLMGFVVAGLDRLSLATGVVELAILIITGGTAYFVTTIAISEIVAKKFRSIISNWPITKDL